MKRYFFIILFLPLYTNAQIIITVAGGGATFGDGGPATAAVLHSPYGVTLDKAGNLYICDNANRRVRKVSPAYSGIITTIAGNGTAGYSGDGFEAIYAEINGVLDVAVDQKGNVYLADASNNRIRKVSPAGIITTYAGTGTAGYNGDGIAATSAMLNMPIGIAVDDTGTIFVADKDNYRIRKIDTFGTITSVAGTGIAGFSPDETMATTASLDNLLCLRTDKNGKLFFLDNARIRKLDADGKIRTIAGNGTFGFSGDGGAATSAEIQPPAFCLDTSGNCYVADNGSHRVRKIGTDGIITTIAGTGLGGYSGDWGDPLLAKLGSPNGVAISPNGDIYIGNASTNRVRMITTPITDVTSAIMNEAGFSIYPNPAYKTLYVERNDTGMCSISMTDMSGREVYTENMNRYATIATIDVGELASGIYTV